MRNDNALWIPPTINPKLPYLSPIERSAEVLRYSCRSFEHTVSPGGGLRKVLKIIGLGFVIAVAAFPVVCIAGCIAAMLAGIVSNLLFVVFWGFIIYVIYKALTHR